MIQPIRKQVLFKPYLGDDKSVGGIIVPDSFRAFSNKGEIQAVGTFVKKVKVGDIVFRVKDWGMPIEENGVTYFIMDEGSFLATD